MIVSAAEIEASQLQALLDKGASPKGAQGWLTDRRWEDEEYQQEQQAECEFLKKYGIGVEV